MGGGRRSFYFIFFTIGLAHCNCDAVPVRHLHSGQVCVMSASIPQGVRDALFQWAKRQTKSREIKQRLRDYFNGGGKRLNLNLCGLSSLPEEIGQLTAMKAFSCSLNNLSSLPEELGQLTALTSFECHHNHLSSLPAAIGQLTALLLFECHLNRLKALPSEIGQMTALTLLYCNNNQLTSLPEEIGRLTALTRFDCSSNQLLSLPTELGQLATLAEFRCFNNPFTEGAPQTLLALQEEARRCRRTKAARPQ